MLYLFNIIYILIDITQETVLNWFGLELPSVTDNFENSELLNNYELDINTTLKSTDLVPVISIDTLRLIVQGFWEKMKHGLSLADIDTFISIIIIVRFIILAIRYNLITSLLINCIGVFASFLWYRHFFQLLLSYESLLYQYSFTFKLGSSVFESRNILSQQIKSSDYNIRFTNPIGIILYAITNAFVQDGHRIDPISIFLSWLPENWRIGIEPYYYGLYRKIMPLTFRLINQFYREISSFAAYTLSVRIGKTHCPYLIRWHWTMLVMVTFFEPYAMKMLYRCYYFVNQILVPRLDQYVYEKNIPEMQFTVLEINFLTLCMFLFVVTHLTCILLAVFHALCGQYFYVPILTENVELHIGLRDKNTLYSGGYTSWQDKDEKAKKLNRIIPKFWYGWFGRGTSSNWQVVSFIKKFFKSNIKKLLKIIRKIKKRF
jgi:hypothetical protein